mgnify:CR=1 FL=1
MHHAYLIVGDSVSAEEYLHSYLGEMGVKLLGSPDYFVWKDKLFGVDDARTLASSAVRRAFTEKKIFFVAPEKITLEAQNALLKTFEDPIENTLFFLAVREEELIIPTLRSRMQTIKLQHSVLHEEAEKFIKLSPAERLKFAGKFIDNEKNLSVFLDELLMLSRSKKIYDVRKFSDDRSASPRLILEHLALVL